MLGALLRLTYQRMLEQQTQWLAASEYADLQPAHSSAIQPLWDAPAGERITTLARLARITKQSMSALVDHLEKTGYVERVEDPEDARAIRVRLTARGRAFGRAVRGFARELEATWAAKIGTARVDDLKAALQQLATD
ncbi:MAG TPA: MarR family transcriptional regulator [Kofleriaceae bacterium]|nr:MarR family transcriptional regulator [Kofleriaceae bacterium]